MRKLGMRMSSIALNFICCIAATHLITATPARAQQFTMKLSAPTVGDMNHEWMKRMKAGVEARSNGRIKVEVYPANQLGQIPRTVEGAVEQKDGVPAAKATHERAEGRRPMAGNGLREHSHSSWVKPGTRTESYCYLKGNSLGSGN